MRWNTDTRALARRLGFTAVLLALGGAGAEAAAWAGLPMPYMLGSLGVTALLVAFAPRAFPEGYRFPMPLRQAFIALIGVMIGTQVDPAFVEQLPRMGLSLLAVTLFVLAAHAMNYQLFRRLGGYDAPTAFFCGTPGGLMESVTLGEAAGADIRLLTLAHFLRVIIVVTVVPVGLSVLHGAPLGSAAGVSLSHHEVGLAALGPVILVGAAGLALGRVLRIPASQLTGPLVVAAVIGGAGIATLDAPRWCVPLAQMVIGTSLGVRFVGITRRLLTRALALALVSVSAMLALGGALALAVHAANATPVEVLFISLSPGGVTEMGLIALSLHVNPAFVTFHHLYRIALTVGEMSLVSRLRGLRG